jgi:hypothetical protein
VIDKTVEFGASDAAMSDEEMQRVPGGVQLIPMTAGSLVIAYYLPEVKELKLSRKAYSEIFLGKIKKWNDPEIAKTNPGAKLPDLPVNVVVRADSSGTSFVFSKHLSAISPEFDKTVGTHKMPNWPVGTKSKGNEVVTASLMTTALDPIATRKIEELMTELRKKFTIAIVTHNLQQAQRVADYIDTSAGGSTGYLVEFNESKSLFEDPRHSHTQQYIRGGFS